MWISVAAFAAAGAQDKQSQPPQGAMPTMQMMQDCPMNVQGTEIAVADTSDGIALSFTTSSGSVDELRLRVERMAKMHTSPTGTATAMPGMMMPGTAKYEAIAKGARLTLTPKNPAQLDEFRKQVRNHVERMGKEGGCSAMQTMMQTMMQGMMGGAGKPAQAKPEPKPEAK